MSKSGSGKTKQELSKTLTGCCLASQFRNKDSYDTTKNINNRKSDIALKARARKGRRKKEIYATLVWKQQTWRDESGRRNKNETFKKRKEPNELAHTERDLQYNLEQKECHLCMRQLKSLHNIIQSSLARKQTLPEVITQQFRLDDVKHAGLVASTKMVVIRATKQCRLNTKAELP